jgi:hypothetical protein
MNVYMHIYVHIYMYINKYIYIALFHLFNKKIICFHENFIFFTDRLIATNPLQPLYRVFR